MYRKLAPKVAYQGGLLLSVILSTGCTPHYSSAVEAPVFAIDQTYCETSRGYETMNRMRADCPKLEVGDIVFIRIDNPLYRQVASATASWTSHVGIVVDDTPSRVVVAESTFPVSKLTPLAKFLDRSERGIFSVKRLKSGLSDAQKERVREQASKRLGIFYHTGFNLDSDRQYCSKFVFEVMRDAADVEVGDIETFAELLTKNEKTPKWFWRVWYFGFIPWCRRTITPGSQYLSPKLATVWESLQ